MPNTFEIKSPSSARLSDEQYELRIVTTLEDLADLEPMWRSLGEETGGPIEQYDWAHTCATSNGDHVGDLQIVTVTRGDRLAAVVPLHVKRVNGVRRRVMLGVDLFHEPADLLASDPEALAQISAFLARDWRPIEFGRLPEESSSTNALRAALSERGLVIIRPRPSYPYITLDPSWVEPEQHLSSRRRSDLRRKRRRAEKLGQVDVEMITPRPDEVDTLLDEAYAVEARSWKGRARTAMACDSVEGTFCRSYAHAACRQGILRLCFLRIGGRAVAAQLAVVQGGAFWLMKIGYDAELARCSPGIQLLRESISYAAKAGLESFEFLGETEPWIEVWTSLKRNCVSLRAYPYNLPGAAALAADATAKLASQTRQQGLQFTARMRSAAKTCLRPIVAQAARNYIAGDTLEDAKRVEERLARQGLSATIGLWDNPQDNARAVADQYLAGLDALAGDEQSTYLSIKLPALRFSTDLLNEVCARAQSVARRIHFDSLEAETADRTRSMVEDALAMHPGVEIGYTLPGRWRRSLDDACWVSERGLPVRVVRGEWPDPDDPQRDMRAGYLEVIDELAGRARHVSVATHDPVLAAEAVGRLRAAGTPCDLELLHGLPVRASIRQARELGLGIRIYVPYGEAYMPYALSQVRRKPRILWWLAKDLVASAVARRDNRS
jgi:CelD/BcsL family acetyltransferase involved in cellulose biosynthesis